MWPVVFVFALMLVFAAAFILVVGLPYWTQTGSLTLSNAQGARVVQSKPFTFTSSADVTSLPVFLPQEEGMYSGSVTLHVSSLRNQVVSTTGFYLLRKDKLVTLHEEPGMMWPPAPTLQVSLGIVDGKCFATVTNPEREQTTYSIFTSFKASRLS